MMIFLLLPIARADCDLAVIAPSGQLSGRSPEGAEITPGVAVEGGWLATGSLVRLGPGCPTGRGVTVISESWHYRHPTLPPIPPGKTRCVSEADLAPLGGQKLIALSPAPDGEGGLPPGTLLTDLTCTERGYAAAGHPDLSARQLAWVRPISLLQEASILAVQATYTAHFGPISLGEIPFTDWGYVGLPLPTRLSRLQIAAEVAAEELVTATQREKVTTDLGPVRDGVPVYTHFTGADPRYSDLWARPETITALLRLAARWSEQCQADPPASCTLQIGDLAWYADQLPDPLGHADHHQGTCADIRLFRDDGSRYEAYYSRPDDRGRAGGYSAALTAAFLRLAAGEASVLFFNDPAVISDVPAVRARSGHDDHIHLCF
jgi:hypothetical protein